MSRFDEQIRERQRHDRLHLHRAVRCLSGAVNREDILESGMHLSGADDETLYELCRFFGLPDKQLSSDLTDMEEKLNFLLGSRGVMRRRVTLDGAWWKDMSGPVLCRKKDGGAYVPLFQNAFGGYYYKDKQHGTKVRINKHNAGSFEPEVLCFYRPLPMRKLKAADMLRYALKCPALSDWVVVFFAHLACNNSRNDNSKGDSNAVFFGNSGRPQLKADDKCRSARHYGIRHLPFEYL